MENKELNRCKITNSSIGIKYLDLGEMPIVNNFEEDPSKAFNSPRYPLRLQHFTESGLHSLDYIVDPSILYKNYTYRSGVNEPYVDHCRNMATDILGKFKGLFGNKNLIIDIGGNDGTLLNEFIHSGRHVDLRKHFEAVNVDPADIEQVNPEITHHKKYWGTWTYQDFTQEAQVILSTNVFQHTEHIMEFAEGVYNTLDDYGVWVLEFPYHMNTIFTKQYDQLYHEHLFYHTVTSIQTILKFFGMKIIDISYHDIHGGSLRLEISKNELLKEKVGMYPSFENLVTSQHLVAWGQDINKLINVQRDYLSNLSRNGVLVYGFGAAAKGVTFLNAAKIGPKQIPFVMDETKSKVGKFIPGCSSAKIIHPDEVFKDKNYPEPEYIVILAHNFKDYIMRKLRDMGYNGKFLVMFPYPQEVIFR